MDSPKTSQSLQIACADYKMGTNKQNEKMIKEIIQIRKIKKGARTLFTFFLLVHDDDVIPLQMRDTISTRYNCRVIRSPLVFSSHNSSNNPETCLSSSNLNKKTKKTFQSQSK